MMEGFAPDPGLAMQARGLTKRYGHVVAMEDADFDLIKGEILAVVGDNGAGKSTLIKVLSGAALPDSGDIYLEGRPAHFPNPLAARLAGIETVYQELAVATQLDIAQNLFLGREMRKSGPLGAAFRQLDKKRMRRRRRITCRRLEFAFSRSARLSKHYRVDSVRRSRSPARRHGDARS